MKMTRICVARTPKRGRELLWPSDSSYVNVLEGLMSDGWYGVKSTSREERCMSRCRRPLGNDG